MACTRTLSVNLSISEPIISRTLSFLKARCTVYFEKFGFAWTIRPMHDCSPAEYKKVVPSNNEVIDGVFPSVKMRGRCAG
jgi:hypothetical protein